jgi:Txe/YoeB family toxin of Txe-Axe toxin-antitoxin module
MSYVLKPGEEKTDEDIKTLEKFVEKRNRVRKEEIFFAEFIPPNELLDRQLKPRLDLIIRDLAIGQILKENTIGFGLWKKLGANTQVPYSRRIEKLKELVYDFQKKGGYVIRYPIPIDKFYQIQEGAHRIALAKRYNILEMPIIRAAHLDIRVRRKLRGVYNIPVLKRLEFTTKEIKYIWSLKNEFYGIK